MSDTPKSDVFGYKLLMVEAGTEIENEEGDILTVTDTEIVIHKNTMYVSSKTLEKITRLDAKNKEEEKAQPLKTSERLTAQLTIESAKFTGSQRDHLTILSKRASTGEFDDFASIHACGVTALFTELARAGFDEFASRVAAGEFDATIEESDAWAQTDEAQEIFKELTDGPSR